MRALQRAGHRSATSATASTTRRRLRRGRRRHLGRRGRRRRPRERRHHPLKRDLDVLRTGVENGRRTFANTLKYISITTSANFGNMVSMALAAPLLPFLPLLPKQILLNNFFSDVPSMAISTDQVDPERVASRSAGTSGLVRRFMIIFGLVSSAFDLITFGVLLKMFHAGELLFHTGWFMVSLITQMVVVLVLRTRRLAVQSRPSTMLMVAMAAVFLAAIALPMCSHYARDFELVPLSLSQLGSLIGIVIAYLGATELLKHWFYRHLTGRGSRHRD